MIAAWQVAAATEVRGDWKWYGVSSETASKTGTLYQLSGNAADVQDLHRGQCWQMAGLNWDRVRNENLIVRRNNETVGEVLRLAVGAMYGKDLGPIPNAFLRAMAKSRNVKHDIASSVSFACQAGKHHLCTTTYKNPSGPDFVCSCTCGHVH